MNKNPKILGVQKVLRTGKTKNNPLINVNKFFNLGDMIGFIKEGNSVIMSRARKGEKRHNVCKSGTSLKLSLYGISEKMDYFTAFELNSDEILLTPSTSEEIIRFAHKARRSEDNEALVVAQSGTFYLYIKQPFLNVFNAPVVWTFYKTPDNLMWFELSDKPLSEENAFCSGIIRENMLYVPKKLHNIIPLDSEQRFLICPANGKIIIEVPNACCDICKTPIRRKTDKSAIYQVSETTADIAKNICTKPQADKDSYFNEALKLTREINILLKSL